MDGAIVTAPINLDGLTHTVWYQADLGNQEPRIEPFVPIAILSGMRTRRRVVAEMPASARLLRQLPRIQQIFHGWAPDLGVVPVEAASRGGSERSDGGGVASLFSGGVDSFYTALKHRGELDALVFVHGFSGRLEDPGLRKKASLGAHSAARRLGLALLEVETNAKDFVSAHVPWHQYHGALLAGVALFLSPSFRKVYVPGSLSYDSSFPYGSHPSVDPLWSTEEMELIYDGYESNRFEKVAFIAKDERPRAFLRVCGNLADRNYNCGWCEKCLRTMVALEIVGVLASCPTFPPLDLRRVAALNPSSPQTWDLWEQNLRAAEQLGCDRTLVDVLRLVVERRDHRRESWTRSVVRSHLSRGPDSV